MKKILLNLLFLSTCVIATAQIGIGTQDPEASSILDVESTTRGFLLPRVSEHTVVVDPAIGLMVYDLTDHCINIFIGDNTWKNLCETSSGGGGGGGVIVTPPTNDPGSINLATKICFDIAESNDFVDGCGALALRTNIGADFSDVATHTQTLTITATTNGISDIVVQGVDQTGKVLLNVNQPPVDNILAGESTTASIEYKQDLNTSALNINHEDRYIVSIYVTYTEGGNPKQSKISPYVKDCNCSSINNDDSESAYLIDDNGDLYSAGSNYYSSADLGRAGSNVEFRKVDIPSGVTTIHAAGGLNQGALVGSDGKLYIYGASWGPGGDVLGTGNVNATYSTNPIIEHPEAPSSETFISVGLSSSNIFALTSTGKLYGGGEGAGIGEIPSNINLSDPKTFKHISLTDPSTGQPAFIVSYVADYRGFMAIDDKGNVYGGGVSETCRFGNNEQNYISGSSVQTDKFKQVPIKLGLVPAGTAFNSTTTSLLDFPAKATYCALAANSSAILLENGEIYVCGDQEYGIIGEDIGFNTNLATNSRKVSIAFSKLIIDGDAANPLTKMGMPVKIFLNDNIDFANLGLNEHSTLYVLDDKGDVYAKGRGADNFAGSSGWDNGFNSQLTFKKLDLSVLDSDDEVVEIITNSIYTMFLTAKGKVYYTGNDKFKHLDNAVSTSVDQFSIVAPGTTIVQSGSGPTTSLNSHVWRR